MNVRLGKVRFNSLSIILDLGSSSSIIVVKQTQHLKIKCTNIVCWITKKGILNNNFSSKLENVLPKLYATKIVTLNFHVDDSQGKNR